MDLHQHLVRSTTAESAQTTSDRARNHQLQLALATAEDGFPVFPVCPNTKKPMIVGSFKNATTDVAQIITWWNRWHYALIAIPTGESTGLSVLDIDVGGEAWFRNFLATEGLETEDDLTAVWAITPSSGRHYYFECEAGTTPRTRAGDIAPNVDSRGEGGSIIVPGNIRRGGRSYVWGGRDRLHDVRPMPRKLCYLKTFNAVERRLIMEVPVLREAMQWATPVQWANELEFWRRTEQERVSAKMRNQTPDGAGMRLQATHDLAEAAAEVAGLEDGRRTKLFSKACGVGKYVANLVLTEIEFRSAFIEASRANGALAKYGSNEIIKTIRNALIASQTDQLPPLAREFRTGNVG